MEPMMLIMLLAIGFAVIFALQAVKNGRRASAEEKVMKGYFLLGLSGIMAKVANADGKVTKDEAELAQRFFARMDLSDAERATCIGNFVIARRDGLEARDHVKRFMAYANRTASVFLYDMLWRIALIDDTLDPAEDRLLKDVARYLGLDESDYERFKRGDKPHYDSAALRDAGVPQTFIGMAR